MSYSTSLISPPLPPRPPNNQKPAREHRSHGHGGYLRQSPSASQADKKQRSAKARQTDEKNETRSWLPSILKQNATKSRQTGQIQAAALSTELAPKTYDSSNGDEVFYQELCQSIDGATFDEIDRSYQRSEPAYGHAARSGDARGMPALADDQSIRAYYISNDLPADSTRRFEMSGALVDKADSKTKFWSKVDRYANSRLPPHLPPFRATMDCWRLMSIAARYSESTYHKPTSGEKEARIEASWLRLTKTMVLKWVPIDHQSTLVIAIRGTQTFSDWALNFRTAPASPRGFLDDEWNMCHAGFLSVARSMAKPVAARLRALLEQDPARCNSSLLITGHSAGGAVAALLFAHMLSRTVRSELAALTDVFKRVHCVTFGAPPISLLPLEKPAGVERYRKFVFLGLVNQGDPVARASLEYVSSLARLYLSPAPPLLSPKLMKDESHTSPTKGLPAPNAAVKGILKAAKSWQNLRPTNPAQGTVGSVEDEDDAMDQSRMPIWPVPESAASNAGDLVLLRERHGSSSGRVEACAITDEQLREVVFGDPAAHSMVLYARRVEELAFRAVTGRTG